MPVSGWHRLLVIANNKRDSFSEYQSSKQKLLVVAIDVEQDGEALQFAQKLLPLGAEYVRIATPELTEELQRHIQQSKCNGLQVLISHGTLPETRQRVRELLAETRSGYIQAPPGVEPFTGKLLRGTQVVKCGETSRYLKRGHTSHLTWPLEEDLSDDEGWRMIKPKQPWCPMKRSRTET